MKKTLIMTICSIGAAATIITIMVLSLVLGILGQGCEKAKVTASKMADQTIFNADKHVWTYEQFYAKYEAFEQQKVLYNGAKEQLSSPSVSEGERDGLIMQKQGSFQMMTNIAAEYNKMSDVAYQAIWKSKSLPEKLEAPKP